MTLSPSNHLVHKRATNLTYFTCYHHECTRELSVSISRAYLGDLAVCLLILASSTTFAGLLKTTGPLTIGRLTKPLGPLAAAFSTFSSFNSRVVCPFILIATSSHTPGTPVFAVNIFPSFTKNLCLGSATTSNMRIQIPFSRCLFAHSSVFGTSMFASLNFIGGRARSSCRKAVVFLRKGKMRRVTNSSFVLAVVAALAGLLIERAKFIRFCRERRACSGIWRKTW